MAVDNTHFKGSWRPEEDTALRQSVTKHGEKNWSAVARTFNELMGRHPLLGRAPKQCRSRYLQQLVPGIKTGEWSVAEEETLVEGHRQFGNQWTLIASMLPGRTETAVKNHYNCTARRKVPSDAGRMTILQRYLATIGIISATPGSKGSARQQASGANFYARTSSAAAAATGGAATRNRSSSRRAAASAPAGGPSPSGSGQGYDEYASSAALAHAYSEADFGAYAAYAAAAAAYAGMDPHALAAAMGAAAAEAAAGGDYGADCGSGGEQHEEEEDDEGTSTAADGLLALAHAALLHLEELGCEDEEAEAAGSGSGEQHDTVMHTPTPTRVEGGGEHDHELQQQQPGSSKASKASPLEPRGSGVPSPWGGKADRPVSSEESDHTAEEADHDGSPLAAAAAAAMTAAAIKAGSKRSSPHATASGDAAAGTHTAGGASKRARSQWAGCSSRPVLDVSEPEGCGATGGATTTTTTTAATTFGCGGHPPALSIPTPNSASPIIPSALSSTSSHDANAALVALIMGAFMGGGAADGGAAAGSGSTHAVVPQPGVLPSSALAAIARVVASSMQAEQQQQQPAGAEGAEAAGAAVAADC